MRAYLDANATTPLDPRVRAAMEPWLDCGNASSLHAEGRAARGAIDRAREQVAALVGARAREIAFTSGATEANAIALLGAVRANAIRVVACSAVEHPSVLRALEALRPGVDVSLVGVGRDGRVPADAPLPKGAGLVSVMLANNETGAVQPVRAIAERARAAGALVHTDAVQACGKMRVDVDGLGVHLLSLSAHKMHGPKGAGALYVRGGVRVAPLSRGGEHERGLRPGTEDVAAIAGLGAAAALAARELDARRALWTSLRERFLARLRSEIPSARVHSPADGVPNTISVSFPGIPGDAILAALDLAGVAVSTGSACASGAAEPSHVLVAQGLSREEAAQAIRASLHAGSTERDVDVCLNELARCVKRLGDLRIGGGQSRRC
ncbi:MAG TPA: cysteine desulfurase family protein [Planctomycetota bacterium]|nr:cysteine desulfurase family protein [Planctomycetota bacterium]